MCDVEVKGKCIVITMKMGDGVNPNSGKNSMNYQMLDNLHKALDQAEAIRGKAALIITSTGKVFSDGLDLGWITKDRVNSHEFLPKVWKLLGRLLVFPMVTIAAVNGHAFGGGFFLSLACDYRVMRTGRGFLCFPEVNLGMPISHGFAGLAKCKLPSINLRTAFLEGKKYSAEEALKREMVDQICSLEDLESTYLALGEKMALKRTSMTQVMKREIFHEGYKACMQGIVYNQDVPSMPTWEWKQSML